MQFLFISVPYLLLSSLLQNAYQVLCSADVYNGMRACLKCCCFPSVSHGKGPVAQHWVFWLSADGGPSQTPVSGQVQISCSLQSISNSVLTPSVAVLPRLTTWESSFININFGRVLGVCTHAYVCTFI